MKWTKLKYGECPDGEIVMLIKDYLNNVNYVHGFISRSRIDNEWYLYGKNRPDIWISIDSIYDTEPHYIELDKVEMPE